MDVRTVRARLMTPARMGAVAIIQAVGDAEALDGVLARLCGRTVAAHGLGLREVEGVDTVLVGRPTPGCVEIMPHGGKAVIDGLISGLRALGVDMDAEWTARQMYPEAASRLEAEMLAVLARAASPAAVDVLLAQPEIWARECGPIGPDELPAGEPTEIDGYLGRLIEPPTVVAWGPANIGKSTLCNTLAKREVAIVADEPGTTRDHVGVMLEVGSENGSEIAVRFVDTPGVRAGVGAEEREAAEIAARMIAAADLILCCHDPFSEPVEPPAAASRAQRLTVMLRADLSGQDRPGSLRVSSRSGEGVKELAGAIRDALIPVALTPPSRWRFWE